jgi:hypothetical protein
MEFLELQTTYPKYAEHAKTVTIFFSVFRVFRGFG